jgi:hypothetical protein
LVERGGRPCRSDRVGYKTPNVPIAPDLKPLSPSRDKEHCRHSCAIGHRCASRPYSFPAGRCLTGAPTTHRRVFRPSHRVQACVKSPPLCSPAFTASAHPPFFPVRSSPEHSISYSPPQPHEANLTVHLSSSTGEDRRRSANAGVATARATHRCRSTPA